MFWVWSSLFLWKLLFQPQTTSSLQKHANNFPHIVICHNESTSPMSCYNRLWSDTSTWTKYQSNHQKWSIIVQANGKWTIGKQADKNGNNNLFRKMKLKLLDLGKKTVPTFNKKLSEELMSTTKKQLFCLRAYRSTFDQITGPTSWVNSIK